MGGKGSGRAGKAGKGRRVLAAAALEALHGEMESAGEEGLPAGTGEEFRRWVKRRAEGELWFYARWVLGNDWLGLGRFHRDLVCPFLTDFTTSRMKLLMLPMGHLKTTVASRALPTHVLIQPASRNIYFPGKSGAEMCVLLANENEAKCKDNFAVNREHLESNELFYWLWPHLCWDSPKNEARIWTDTDLVVPRNTVRAEPSIKAVGIKTGFVGSYWDVIIPDDIAALEAAQNPPLMARAAKWRRTAKTRRVDKTARGSIIVGVGTHWGSNDIYVDWKKDTDFEVMIRSIIEYPDGRDAEVSLWPEKYPLDLVHQMREGMDPIEWALWYMNKPVPAGFTALEWNDVREYREADGGATLIFEESAADEAINARFKRIAKNLGFTLGENRYNPANGKLRMKPAQGMSPDFFNYMKQKYTAADSSAEEPKFDLPHLSKVFGVP